MSKVAQRIAVVSISDGGALAADGGYDMRPRRALVALTGVAGACVLTLALVVLAAAPAPRSGALPSRHGLQSWPAASLPSGLLPAVSSTIGATDRSFWPARRGASLMARSGGMRSTFTASGTTLGVAQGTLGLSLAAVGRGHHLVPVSAVPPSTAGARVLYRHGPISESYRAGPYGLEQGFTVRRRPQPGRGSLVLALRLRGSLIPEQLGSRVLFETHAGIAALRYGELTALDATGRRLPAVLQLSNGTLELRIDDRNARYPLVIDPFIQQGSKLTGGGEVGAGAFGISVALSASGRTALIGGHDDDGNVGAAWVFTRSGSTWTQQGPKLTGGGETGDGEFGMSVALSGDGNVALIGGRGDNGHVGAAWVFTRSRSTWTQQGSKLTGSGEIGKGSFGVSVALSSDGHNALIGGEFDHNSEGAAWVFTRSGSTWSQQGPKLTGSGEIGFGLFGFSVALSGDGNTALVGGYGDNSFLGAAWVFTRSGSTWNQQGSKLIGDDESGGANSGDSVALSGDGNTALIGGDGDNGDAGAVWVFTRSGSTWTQQGAKLTGGGEIGSGTFGASVALSGAGNVALIGGFGDNGHAGAAWVFTRSGSTWTQQGPKLTGSGEIGRVLFSFSAALSADGNTALIGDNSDSGGVGAAWIFQNLRVSPPTVVTEAASAVGQTSATLTATVNPSGRTVSDCHFDYGTTLSYGKSVRCASRPGSGESPVAVSASLRGLNANTTYHFRIVATNPKGTSKGGDETFTTLTNCLVVNLRAHQSYETLEQAIEAATAGDTLKVRGTCEGSSSTVSKNLTIVGQGSPGFGPATLNGRNGGSVVVVNEGVTVSITGLTITGGSGSDVPCGTECKVKLGGGILNNGSLTLINSTVAGNTAAVGGGIYNAAFGNLDGPYAGSVTFCGSSSVSGNTASVEGGGIFSAGTIIYGIGWTGTVSANIPDDIAK